MGSWKRPPHEATSMKSRFPADTVGKPHGMALAGAARNAADALLALQELTVDVLAEAERIEKFNRHE